MQTARLTLVDLALSPLYLPHISLQTARLTLVDLAGSERLKKSREVPRYRGDIGEM